MKAGRFFSVHYDMRHNPKIELLRDMQGGIVAYGRWMVLLAILYDSGGVYVMDTPIKKRLLLKELEFDSDGLEEFLKACAECELIDAGLLEVGHVASSGVCEQLEYYKTKSEAGKKGMQSRWKNRDNSS